MKFIYLQKISEKLQYNMGGLFYLNREDFHLFRVVSNSKFVLVGGKWYEKKIETNFSSRIVSYINMEHM